MSQPPMPPPAQAPEDRRGRIFSFTGGLGSRQVSHSSQPEEDVSPAFGKRTARHAGESTSTVDSKNSKILRYDVI